MPCSNAAAITNNLIINVSVWNDIARVAGMEERHEVVKYKRRQYLVLVTSLLTKGSTVSQVSKSTWSCVRALSSQSSIVMGTGNPWVFLGVPVPIPAKTPTRGNG